jgi:signal transduction histidine kinase
MGEMASAMAHELKQPLAAINYFASACANLVTSGGADDGKQIDYLNDIREQSLRAGKIISRLRDFVRKREPHHAPVDIGELIRETVGFVMPQAHEKRIKIRLQLDDRLPPVAADRIQIEQVILNLVRNAMEAVDGDESAQQQVLIQTAVSNDYLEVSVSDTGPPLSRDVIERAFERFFTTKAKGMGLGLPISRSIIEAHGGRLGIKANPGRGATVWFTLPVAQEGEPE